MCEDTQYRREGNEWQCKQKHLRIDNATECINAMPFDDQGYEHKKRESSNEYCCRDRPRVFWRRDRTTPSTMRMAVGANADGNIVNASAKIMTRRLTLS